MRAGPDTYDDPAALAVELLLELHEAAAQAREESPNFAAVLGDAINQLERLLRSESPPRLDLAMACGRAASALGVWHNLRPASTNELRNP